MRSFLNHKKVLFITTKNLDYIRNTQEITLIEECALSYKVIGSYSQSYFVRLLCVYVQLLVTRVSQFDTVFVGFAPQLVLPFWRWKMKKADIVIDFFISMYDTLCCDRKKISESGLLGKLLHKMDAITLRMAEKVICDTAAHGEFFCTEFGVAPDKLETLYLEADSKVYYPRTVERPEHLCDKFIVLYFGSVLPLQGVDVVWKAMDLLKDKKNIFFFFIGPLENGPVSDNISYIKWLPQEKLAEYIEMADLCLAGHFNASIAKASRTIPGKAYIYRAMGKPMILGDNPANHELFTEGDGVSFVEMGNPQALADMMVLLLGTHLLP